MSFFVPHSFDELDIKSPGVFESLQMKLPKDSCAPEVIGITPSSGFCVKVKNMQNEKIFINICHCFEIPKPPEVSEEKLLQILEVDATTFRIPMSIGEPHEEKDRNGNVCFTCDIVINSDFFKEVQQSEVFRTFLVTVCCEGVKEKYNVALKDDSWVILKNKCYHGAMPKHFIRKKPIIAELRSNYFENEKDLKVEKLCKTLPYKHSNPCEVPGFILRRRPNSFEELLLIVHLPKTTSCKTISVNAGEDRVVITESINRYSLDIFLPYIIIPEKCFSKFYFCKKVLLVSFAVDEKSSP